MNPLFAVNLREFVAQVLGALTRQPRQVAWLSALTAPARNLFSQVVATRAAATYTLAFTGQTIVLEQLLNLTWPAASGAITISNQEATEAVFYLYADGYDTEPVNIYADGGASLLYDDPAILPLDVSFVVLVPSTLIFVQAEMRALIDRYKMVGTSYRIEVFEAEGE